MMNSLTIVEGSPRRRILQRRQKPFLSPEPHFEVVEEEAETDDNESK